MVAIMIVEQIFIGIASLIHVYVFALESLLWGKPKTNGIFGMSAELASHNRLFAFNQGFYNLFLALGSAAGIGLDIAGYSTVGISLQAYSGLSMIGAAVVLLYSQPKLVRPALIQGLPPLLGFIGMAIRLV